MMPAAGDADDASSAEVDDLRIVEAQLGDNCVRVLTDGRNAVRSPRHGGQVHGMVEQPDWPGLAANLLPAVACDELLVIRQRLNIVNAAVGDVRPLQQI